MNNGIFSELAALYWVRGLRVIPIEPGTKKPALVGWQGHVASLPREETQRGWLNKYRGYGIGLLLGSEIVTGFQIIALDIDDDRLVGPTLAFLGLEEIAE